MVNINLNLADEVSNSGVSSFPSCVSVDGLASFVYL